MSQSAGGQVHHRVVAVLVVAISAVILGLGSAWLAVLHWPADQALHVGAWRTSLSAGSQAANPYSRARIAITSLFALDRRETIYFEATTDDRGAALRANCQYRVIGSTLPARWWSITAYADDNFLIANSANRFSFNMGNIAYDADGAFTLLLASSPHPGNWLPSGSQGGIILLLRLYNPAPDVAAEPSAAKLPRIVSDRPCA